MVRRVKMKNSNGSKTAMVRAIDVAEWAATGFKIDQDDLKDEFNTNLVFDKPAQKKEFIDYIAKAEEKGMKALEAAKSAKSDKDK